jgi:hypothetical protein
VQVDLNVKLEGEEEWEDEGSVEEDLENSEEEEDAESNLKDSEDWKNGSSGNGEL